jgi:hypothetical protein
VLPSRQDGVRSAPSVRRALVALFSPKLSAARNKAVYASVQTLQFHRGTLGHYEVVNFHSW